MPYENINPEIMDFVDKYIDCFVSWDLLAYFHENPELEKKPSVLAIDIGRQTPSIEKCLDDFVEKGILMSEGEGGDEPSYRYVAPSGFRSMMDEFLAATRDRTNRLAIVSKVLQKEARRL